MTLSFNLLATICLAYVSFLFLIAALSDRYGRNNRAGFLKSPLIYTLSISVYCTAWTYYGAVGSAARNGLEFLAIYLGPALVFFGWWWGLRKLVRIGRSQRITSIADLISSRYGKSNLLAAMVTILAVIASTPYIALQLQSLSLSFFVFTEGTDNPPALPFIAFIIAMGLAAFTILFGTRALDAEERHHGVVIAIAFEAVVKLFALIAIGLFAIFYVNDGLGATVSLINEKLAHQANPFSARWVTLSFLSATAIICLPRMFQVVVVENSAEAHLATASWAFPLYLFLMCLFVLPIAVTGLEVLPAGANPDLFVLSLPLAFEQDFLAALAFLGGFSSATSMVIVAAIALSTMASNHLVLPLWLRATRTQTAASDDLRDVLLRTRRITIAAILGLGYLYYIFTSGTNALASIGLIAFLGVAQILPALIGGLYWYNATRTGAIWGIGVGFCLWAFLLFLPSFDGNFVLSKDVLENGLFGFPALRPFAFLGARIDDVLIHASFWSLSANTLVFIVASLLSQPRPLEQLQALKFISVFAQNPMSRPSAKSVTSEELFVLAQRILGRKKAHQLFSEHATMQGKAGGLPTPSGAFIETLENAFAGSVGAATAHAMMGQIVGETTISVDALLAVADETAQIMEYSNRLKKQSKELSKTAQELRQANEKLTELSRQKDDFLSQVSHELRTPMTSILSFSDILKADKDLPAEKLQDFASIIHTESQRLTRLLDQILDLSFLESGKIKLNLETVPLSEVISAALGATRAISEQSGAKIKLDKSVKNLNIQTDPDRLSQVIINLISNSIKYTTKSPTEGTRAEITIKAKMEDSLRLYITDNGPGIEESAREIIFEKFARAEDIRVSGQDRHEGVGLGLPISQKIMRALGGDLVCLPAKTGACFCLIFAPDSTPKTTGKT